MKKGEFFKGASGKAYQYTGPDGGEPNIRDASTYKEIVEPEPFVMRQPEYEKPGVMARVGRGFTDIGQGVQQLARRAMGDPQKTAEWEQQQNAELRAYEQGQGDSFDGARLIGNIAASAPLMAIPGGAGGGILARAGLGATAGATGAAANYTPTDSGDFIGNKLVQTGVGAVAGGALSAAMPGIARAVGSAGKLIAKIPRALGITTNGDIVVQIVNEAKNRGVDLNLVPKTIRDGFIKDAMDQLNATGNLDIDAVARKANLERWGFEGTVGQVTRNPRQWQKEQNLMQLDEIGDPIQQRMMQQNQQMMDKAESVAGRFSPPLPEAQVGLNARKVSEDAARLSQETVSKAYDDAANTPGIGDLVTNPDNIKSQLTNVYDAFSDAIPGPIKKRVESLVDGRIAPTVENVNTAIKLVNQRLAVAKDATEEAALSRINRLLNSELDNTAAAGGAAAQSLRDASRLAAQRFGFIRGSGTEETKLMDRLIDGNRADNLVSRLMTGDVDDLVHLKRFFTGFDQTAFPKIPKSDMVKAWDQIRGAVVRKMNEKARYGDPKENSFSGFQLEKAWNQLGEIRQRTLFSDDERELIGSFIDAVVTMTKAPPFEKSNKSGTAGALMNFGGKMMSRLKTIPGMGPMVDGALTMLEMGKQAAVKVSDRRSIDIALTGRPYTEQQRRALEAQTNALAGKAGALPAAAAGAQASNYQRSKPRNK